MKKLLTAMVGTGLFLSCNALSFTPDCANCGYASGLCAPKFAGGFYAGITGSWLHVSESGVGLNEVIFGESNEDGVSINSKLFRFNQDHDWQWGLNVGYDIPCSSYSLELSYFHIDDNDDLNHRFDDGFDRIDSFFITNLGFPIAAFADVTDPITIIDYDVHSELKLKFDQLDLKFGRQYNDVCGHFQIKPSIGLRYAKVDHKYHTRFEGELFDVLTAEQTPFINTVVNQHAHSEFDGIGPLASFDARYGFCGGFGIVGHFDAALLVGEVDSHLGVRTDLAFLDGIDGVVLSEDTTETRWHVPSTDRVVTALSGKIGLDYSFCFCNKSSLTVELGYQASKYYDAVDLLRGEDEISPLILPVDNTSVQRVTATESNSFDFRGPYLNVTYHM